MHTDEHGFTQARKEPRAEAHKLSPLQEKRRKRFSGADTPEDLPHSKSAALTDQIAAAAGTDFGGVNGARRNVDALAGAAALVRSSAHNQAVRTHGT